MICNQKLLSVYDINHKIDNYLNNSQVIKLWTAEVQRSLKTPTVFDATLNKHKEVSPMELKDGEIEFFTYFEKNLTLHEIKLLSMISWWLPKEVTGVIQLATMEYFNKYKLLDHLDLRIYMLNKNVILTYLFEKEITTETFFGQLGIIENRISKDADMSLNRKDSIFRPFWIQRSNSKLIKKYTGYCKHYKDHGSLRSDVYHLTEYLNDDSFYNLYQKRLKEIQETDDTFDFLLGYLS